MPPCEICGLQSTYCVFKKASTGDSKKIQEISLKNQVSIHILDLKNDSEINNIFC